MAFIRSIFHTSEYFDKGNLCDFSLEVFIGMSIIKFHDCHHIGLGVEVGSGSQAGGKFLLLFIDGQVQYNYRYQHH